MHRRMIPIGVLALSLFILARAAEAHVTASPDQAAAGSYVVIDFTVPHGCAGAPTTAVRIKIPEGIASVKPQVKPGWEITVVTRRLDPPIRDEHGNAISQTVDEIDWRGGPLRNDFFDSFNLLMKLPATPGATLYFPTVQECSAGIHRWIGIPAPGQKWEDLEEPAPFLHLIP